MLLQLVRLQTIPRTATSFDIFDVDNYNLYRITYCHTLFEGKETSHSLWSVCDSYAC